MTNFVTERLARLLADKIAAAEQHRLAVREQVGHEIQLPGKAELERVIKVHRRQRRAEH